MIFSRKRGHSINYGITYTCGCVIALEAS